MSRTPLFDALKIYESRSMGYFRIPGHRFEKGIPKPFLDFAGKEIFKLDITETPLSDDLHNPKTVIAESQQYTAEAFGAERSFYLVNGTTCGNQAMIIASAGEGEKILVPRNAHKSVMAGLIMSGARPVYMPVDYLAEIGLTGVLKPETAAWLLEKHPDSKAVFAVSPSYHGFCSDIRSLAVTAHKHSIPLLVDEAHGAHLYFCSRLPKGALKLGADACAQSLHKTAGSLTQSSLLHLSTDSITSRRITPERVDSALRMTMSTSPSYILMSSLELARNDMELHGEEYWSRTIELAVTARHRINRIRGLGCPGTDKLSASGIQDWDPTRLIINCDNADTTGYQLKSKLWTRYGIDVEMADSRNILLLLSYGNTKTDVDNLIAALKELSNVFQTNKRLTVEISEEGQSPAIPEMVLTPRQAYFSKSTAVPWDEMIGKVAAESAAPYPPGIPVIYPGEVITKEIFTFLDTMKKQNIHLHGIGDKTLSSIRICELSNI